MKAVDEEWKGARKGAWRGRREAGTGQICEAQCRGGGKSSPVITQQVPRVIQARGRPSLPLLRMGTEAEKERAGSVTCKVGDASGRAWRSGPKSQVEPC